ncbi:hypothetical protein K0M31_004414 [Melipona bicolor]|uniref:Uncharacterized protein n=1 Tax=Melipona bicolor TaxID=60889 RepID=A0AA40FXQ3_9HYME|nr:hypothetical protein K0M31_004414 [Melipona bicolor]
MPVAGARSGIFPEQQVGARRRLSPTWHEASDNAPTTSQGAFPLALICKNTPKRCAPREEQQDRLHNLAIDVSLVPGGCCTKSAKSIKNVRRSFKSKILKFKTRKTEEREFRTIDTFVRSSFGSENRSPGP